MIYIFLNDKIREITYPWLNARYVNKIILLIFFKTLTNFKKCFLKLSAVRYTGSMPYW